MLWNKKDDKGHLPDLPPLNTPPVDTHDEFEEMDEIDDSEKHTLPTFPDSPTKRGFSQTAIKEAIEDKDSEISSPEIKLKEISAPSATLPKLPSFSKMIDNSEMNKEMPKNMNFKQKNQDVYVQIDRFYSAKRALSSIRSKVEEIDSTLNKIRETRIHEEQTLSSWEKEVMSLKNKISEINDSLFQKIE